MPLTNSVIRRYTPPTCTLEVMAQSSPLSRWVGKSVLKQLRFELRFDDPRLSEEQRVVIRGDRDQLEALCAAVTSYVQEFLQMSPENFGANFSGFEDSSKESDVRESEESKPSTLSTQTVNSFNNNQEPGTDIHLKPSSHLTHNLFLGSLAYQASTPVIQLTLLQLFDLATALDEYSEDVLALPVLYQTRSSAIPAWAPVAAVLLLGVGLLPLTVQYANRARQEWQTAKSDKQEEKTALESSPSPNLAAPSPGLTPPDQLPPVPLGSSSLPLPGSPPAAQISPGQPVAPGTIPPQTSAKAPGSSPSSPGATSTFPSSPSSQTSTPPGQTSAPLTLTNPQIAIQPNIPKQNSGASAPQSATAPQNGKSPNLPDTTGSISSSISTLPPPITNVPTNPTSNARNQTSLPNNSSATLDDNPQLTERLRQGRNTPQEVATGTLFDYKAQVAEARAFLSKRWQPPANLKQAIQYSLIVGVDGRIERIFPLGKAARDYVDRSGMPLIGEPFVSPNKNGQAVRIRAVLNPDGKVQTFPEKE